jgi:hypothetical protein
VLRPWQYELAPIEKITTAVFGLLQQPGVNLQSGLEFVIANRNRIPDNERPPSVELQMQVNKRVLAVVQCQAPHFVHLYAHALNQSVVIQSPFIERIPVEVTHKMANAKKGEAIRKIKYAGWPKDVKSVVSRFDE